MRGEAGLLLVLSLQQVGHRAGALAVPALGHLAMRSLLLEHFEHVLAVDDLRMMVDTEDARHLSSRVTCELEHRHGCAVLVFE